MTRHLTFSAKLWRVDSAALSPRDRHLGNQDKCLVYLRWRLIFAMLEMVMYSGSAASIELPDSKFKRDGIRVLDTARIPVSDFNRHSVYSYNRYSQSIMTQARERGFTLGLGR